MNKMFDEILTDYETFCIEADKFIEDFKRFYEEKKKNGKDFETICEI